MRAIGLNKKVLVSGALLIGALALFPASAESAPQCSRNSDDIKSAVVIQKENGEFCAVDEKQHQEMQNDLAAYHTKSHVPPQMESDPRQRKGTLALSWAPDYQLQVQMLDLGRLSCVLNPSSKCAGGSEAIISSMVTEFQRAAKCTKKGGSLYDCDAEMLFLINAKKAEIANKFMSNCSKKAAVNACERYFDKIVDAAIAGS
jgi:hypothetical protein